MLWSIVWAENKLPQKCSLWSGCSRGFLRWFCLIIELQSEESAPTVSGVTSRGNPSRKATWRSVLEKIRSKLAGWKRRLASLAGRLTLIKSVTSSLPAYYLSIFKMPNGVAKEIEKLQATFLWGGLELKKNVHLVQWKEVAKSMVQGGLGIRRMKEVNTCLLIKWWWRFGVEKDALCRRIVCSKYKLEVGGWMPNIDFTNNFSRVWNDIVSIANQSNILLRFYLDNCQIRVGDGRRIKFSSDRWCVNRSLKEEFPILYRLVVDEGVSLNSMSVIK